MDFVFPNCEKVMLTAIYYLKVYKTIMQYSLDVLVKLDTYFSLKARYNPRSHRATD